jgi:hypothetical protein
MRSLLIKGSLIILIVLATGSGLTTAATSSEPGMFLYPIKQTTQRLAGALRSVMANLNTPQDRAGQQPGVGHDSPASNAERNATQVPASMETHGTDEATATPAPEDQAREDPGMTQTSYAGEATATRVLPQVQITDEITTTVRSDTSPSLDANATNNMSGSPDISQALSSGQDQHRDSSGGAQPDQSLNNNQPNSSTDHNQPDDHQKNGSSQDSGNDQHSQSRSND